MFLFTNASFGSPNNLESQIVFVLLLVDKKNNANITYCESSGCKYVTKYVIAAEILALLYGFDNEINLQHVLQEQLETYYGIHALVESKTLFNFATKNDRKLGSRLQIVVLAMRESFSKCEQKSLSWIADRDNITDTLRKGLISDDHSLRHLMN